MPEQPNLCHNAGEKDDCQTVADPRYYLDYTDVDPKDGMIRFCAACGPAALELDAAVSEALRERGPEFVEKAAKLVADAEREQLARDEGIDPKGGGSA
jgi:hypothetical protein